MARMAVADLEAAVAAEPQCHQRPPEAHTRSSTKPEPAVLATILETLPMSELRQRLHMDSSPTTRALDDESSPETSPTLTPTSIAEAHGQAKGKDEEGRSLGNLKKDNPPLRLMVEDTGLLFKVKTVSSSLLNLVKPTSSRPTPEEVEELNKFRGYDKLKYERGEQYGFSLPGSWLILQFSG
jgi:hypothetical protein